MFQGGLSSLCLISYILHNAGADLNSKSSVVVGGLFVFGCFFVALLG